MIKKVIFRIVALYISICIISCTSKEANVNTQTEEDIKTLSQIIEEHVGKKSIDEIEALLETGDINAKNTEGSTALMIAAAQGYIEIAAALIENGADVNAKDNYGNTAYTKANQNNKTQMIQLLVSLGSEIAKTLEQLFDEYKNSSGVGYIIELVESSGINGKDDEGDNAISLSIDYGYPEIAKALIGERADVNTTSRFGYTMLCHAAASGYLDIVEIILIQGEIDINSNSNFSQSTALMLAASRGHTEIVKLLIGSGADVSILDSENCTALIHATNEDFIEIVNLLKAAEIQEE